MVEHFASFQLLMAEDSVRWLVIATTGVASPVASPRLAQRRLKVNFEPSSIRQLSLYSIFPPPWFWRNIQDNGAKKNRVCI